LRKNEVDFSIPFQSLISLPKNNSFVFIDVGLLLLTIQKPTPELSLIELPLSLDSGAGKTARFRAFPCKGSLREAQQSTANWAEAHYPGAILTHDLKIVASQKKLFRTDMN